VPEPINHSIEAEVYSTDYEDSDQHTSFIVDSRDDGEGIDILIGSTHVYFYSLDALVQRLQQEQSLVAAAAAA